MADAYVTDAIVGITECRRAFRPLLYLLFICGFDCTPKPNFCRRAVTNFFRATIFLIFGSFFVAYIPDTMFSWYIKPRNVWHELIGFGQMCMITTTYILISVSYKKLNQCIEVSIVNCSCVIGNDLAFFKAFSKNILNPIIFMFLLTLSAIAYQLMSVERLDFASQYDLPIKQLYLTIISVSYYNQLIFMLTYTSLGDLLYQSLLKLSEKDCRNENDSLTTIYSVQNRHQWFINCHKKLCESIQMMDDVFGVLIAIWNLYQLTSLVFLLKELQVDGLSYDILIGTVVTIVFFIRLGLTSSRVNEKILGSLRQMVSKEYYNNVKVNMDLGMYIHYVSLDPPGLTGWKLYVVDRNFMLAAAGSVISYVLVVYHLHKDEKPAI